MKHSRGGYSIVEMLMAISLVTVFLIISGHLVNLVFKVQRDAVRMEWSVSRMDFALRELRKDVWSASSLTRLDDDRMQIDFIDQNHAIWSFKAEPSSSLPEKGWLTREVVIAKSGLTSGENLRRFEVPRPVLFQETHGRGVTVRVDHHELTLPSQLMIAAGTPRDSSTGDLP